MEMNLVVLAGTLFDWAVVKDDPEQYSERILFHVQTRDKRGFTQIVPIWTSMTAENLHMFDSAGKDDPIWVTCEAQAKGPEVRFWANIDNGAIAIRSTN